MRQIRSLVLPLAALVIIPGLTLLLARSTLFGINMFAPVIQVAAGSLVVLLGLTVMVITIRLLVKIGRGTLAPWDPTSNLVNIGIYARVRNPMITGVLIALLGESFLFGSLGILTWAVLFFVTNTIYFHYREEKGLEKRFGEEYLAYRKKVPMWVPRLKPRGKK